MARPIKTGLDYFSLDVDMDDSIELIEAEHGLQGFAIVVKLWQKIYSEGYYIDWKKDNIMLFSRKINTEETLVSAVVNSCLSRGIFSKELYEEYEVLTSRAIQKRYLTACKQIKRASVPLHAELILISSELTSVITEETSINSGFSTQRKGKEKKGKEKKGKESIDESPEETSDDIIPLPLHQISDLWTHCGYGTLNATTLDLLVADIKLFSWPWVKEAIEIGNMRGKRSYSYMRAILNRWQTDGKEDHREPRGTNPGNTGKEERDYSTPVDASKFDDDELYKDLI